jgi:cyclophilin family peptidyl-prolyl cis-trans isomerase
VIEALDRLRDDRDGLVRREAVAGLAGLGEERPPAGPYELGRGLDYYRSVLDQTAERRRVEVVTDRGTLVVELACPEAPLTCLSFLQLARQGYFDGLAFHRVVPDFVAQGGDPRGDGWGGPGYALRDEINRLRYRRGALGMALSGPDTGGSQFFFTLSPQPHLDGGFTVFGRVIDGEAVLDLLRQGDRIVGVRELDGAPGPVG